MCVSTWWVLDSYKGDMARSSSEIQVSSQETFEAQIKGFNTATKMAGIDVVGPSNFPLFHTHMCGSYTIDVFQILIKWSRRWVGYFWKWAFVSNRFLLFLFSYLAIYQNNLFIFKSQICLSFLINPFLIN